MTTPQPIFRRLADEDLRRWYPVHYLIHSPYWKLALVVLSIVLALKVVTR